MACSLTEGLEPGQSSLKTQYVSDKHAYGLLESLNAMRKTEEFSDVVIAVGSRKIFAHKLVLIACSPYFYAMFHSDMSEKYQTEIKINDVDEQVFYFLKKQN